MAPPQLAARRIPEGHGKAVRPDARRSSNCLDSQPSGRDGSNCRISKFETSLRHRGGLGIRPQPERSGGNWKGVAGGSGRLISVMASLRNSVLILLLSAVQVFSQDSKSIRHDLEAGKYADALEMAR